MLSNPIKLENVTSPITDFQYVSPWPVTSDVIHDQSQDSRTWNIVILLGGSLAICIVIIILVLILLILWKRSEAKTKADATSE